MAKNKKTASLPPRTALIVLGMHRSGTSALAGVLAKMGADLPQDLMPANEFNPDGYFESLLAYKLNDALLGSAGSSWDDWHAVNTDWYGSPRKQEYILRAQEMLEQEFGAAGFFVLKDPRICRLVPFWSEVMAESGIEPLFVCTHRNPVEVAASLARRNGWPESRGLLLWLRHVLDAEADSRGHRRTFVSYDGLLSDWRGMIGRIGADLELRWPIKPETAAPGIEGFLSDSRRTFRAAEMDGPAQGTISGWIGEVHGILDQWVQDGETQSDHQRLDDIRAGLRETDATLSLLMQETQRESEQVRRLQSELEQSHAKISELDAAARTAREDAASHAANHATEQRARANAQTRINELDAALKAARDEAERLQAETASACQARTAAQTRVNELNEALKTARADAETLQANNANDRQARAAADARVKELSEALEAAREEAGKLQTNIATERQARADADARVKELSEALEAAREEAGKLQTNIASERQARADADAHVKELSEALEAAREEMQARSAAEEERYKALVESHDALEAKHDALDKALEQANHERDQLRSQLEQSRTEAQDLHDQTLSDARKIAELDSRLQDLDAEHAALKRKSGREARQLVGMKQQLAIRFSREIEQRLNGDSVRDHEQEREVMLSEWSAERNRIEQARLAAEARIAEFDAALKAARADAERVQADSANERKARAAAEARIAELDAAAKAARADADRVQADSANERKAREAAEARVAELDAAAKAARAEADQLLNSKSWRVTAPLRYVMEKIHGK
ncbi:chromosome partition protein Smc [Roseovarius sp. A-2]|uniref:sulfotransferase n=1 Tax=Roseovarius sp. A-2 TaxID=1570360 RepID=UPI0009B573B2|nr:sulfotransferase [Roseovarius sp. A-2]GAW37224.1 chromosome partition protein Smc [Roseovarius sp. A-2]